MGGGRELRQNATAEVETAEKLDAHETAHLTTVKGATGKMRPEFKRFPQKNKKIKKSASLTASTHGVSLSLMSFFFFFFFLAVVICDCIFAGDTASLAAPLSEWRSSKTAGDQRQETQTEG